MRVDKYFSLQISYTKECNIDLPKGRRCPIGSPGALGKSSFGGKMIVTLWSFGNLTIDCFFDANTSITRGNSMKMCKARALISLFRSYSPKIIPVILLQKVLHVTPTLKNEPLKIISARFCQRGAEWPYLSIHHSYSKHHTQKREDKGTWKPGNSFNMQWVKVEMWQIKPPRVFKKLWQMTEQYSDVCFKRLCTIGNM